MFSRLAKCSIPQILSINSRSIGVSSLISIKNPILPTLNRAISLSLSRNAAATAMPNIGAEPNPPHTLPPHTELVPTKAEPEKSLSSIVKEYGGWWPLIGLGMTVAISKELITISEEFLLVSNTATVFYLLYLSFIDSLENQAKEEFAQHKRFHDELSDLAIESTKHSIDMMQYFPRRRDAFQKLREEFLKYKDNYGKGLAVVTANQLAEEINAKIARIVADALKKRDEKRKEQANQVSEDLLRWIPEFLTPEVQQQINDDCIASLLEEPTVMPERQFVVPLIYAKTAVDPDFTPAHLMETMQASGINVDELTEGFANSNEHSTR